MEFKMADMRSLTDGVDNHYWLARKHGGDRVPTMPNYCCYTLCYWQYNILLCTGIWTEFSSCV